jgi:probable HAF family extracellular repeat protein
LQAFDELPHLPGVTTSTYASAAYGVNRFGQVVGWAQNNSGASRAFLYIPGGGGTMIDLNTLLPSGSGWVLIGARSINDAGVIVGTGTYNGHSPRAWILYPTCQE